MLFWVETRWRTIYHTFLTEVVVDETFVGKPVHLSRGIDEDSGFYLFFFGRLC